MSNQRNTIGVIAEDESDVESLKEIIRNISNGQAIGYKKFVGRGCGKIKRKCSDWAAQLKLKGCNILILVHDLDANDYNTLHNLLENSLKPFAIKNTFISIPIKEMEAWFLADPNSIKKAFSLATTPRVSGHPEWIDSPKEALRDLISKASNHNKIYLNTRHNSVIAKFLDAQVVKTKCPSFDKLYGFIIQKIVA